MVARVSTPPKLQDIKNENPSINLWFQTMGDRVNVYSGAANPTVAQVPVNQWILYNNTALGEIRFWTNIAGTLKKSAAFT